MILSLLAAEITQVAQQAPAALQAQNPALLYASAISLLVVASFFIFLEFAIVSGGILGAFAALTAAFGCYLGFQVGPLAGLSCIFIAPVLGFISIRMGLKRMQNSSIVSQTAIIADAGYHHVASAAGANIGAIGTLLSDAMPTGKAEFGAGEVNVVVQGSAGAKGQLIEVIKINGPCIEVIIATKT